MSLIPAFEIGVWNAWILTMFIFLCVFSSQIIKGVGEKIAHGDDERKLNRYVRLLKGKSTHCNLKRCLTNLSNPY